MYARPRRPRWSAVRCTGPPDHPTDRQAGGRARRRAGRTYTVTKYIGVATASDSRAPAPARSGRVAGRRGLGTPACAAPPTRPGPGCGAPTSLVSGDARLQRQVRASFFALLASVREDTPWAPSPGGLSSDGYNGHVFWDSETWMYPSLLATEPALARAEPAVPLRPTAGAPGPTRRRPAGRAPGSRGRARSAAARRPRRSPRPASSRSTSTPTSPWPCSSTGWPPATGTGWRPRAGRCSRASPTTTPAGRRGTPTAATASATSSRPTSTPKASTTASTPTCPPPRRSASHARRPACWTDPHPTWSRVARGLRILFDRDGHPPRVRRLPRRRRQAGRRHPAVLPVGAPAVARVTAADLDYYVPRTDPGGPSMTDAIHSIVTSQLGTPGCAAFTFTRRSVDPFVRPPYDQFAEARSGGHSPSPPAPAGSCRSSCTATPGSGGAQTGSTSTRACRRS